MRRRRLALRQIAETTQDVSDIDGDDSDAQQQSADEPTFNLLRVTTGAGLQPTAILLSDDEDGGNDQAHLLHERTALPSPHARTPAKKQSQSEKGSAGDNTSSSNSSIFNLYQEGLAPDQVLQLAFTRRRAPRSLRMKGTKPGDDFILPLPSLSIMDLLPTAKVDIRDLFSTNDVPSSSLLSPSLSNMSEDTSGSALNPSSHGAVSHALARAKKFFFTPEEASVEERRSWQSISEREWNQLFQDLQIEALAVTPATRVGRSKLRSYQQQQQAKVPSVDSLCLLLRDCRSDALSQFVWEALLLPVLEEQQRLAVSSSFDRDNRTRELLRLLLLQNCFRAMAPKDFRATVRAKQLRQQLSDAAFGAQVEQQLITLYHSSREGTAQRLLLITSRPPCWRCMFVAQASHTKSAQWTLEQSEWDWTVRGSIREDGQPDPSVLGSIDSQKQFTKIVSERARGDRHHHYHHRSHHRSDHLERESKPASLGYSGSSSLTALRLPVQLVELDIKKLQKQRAAFENASVETENGRLAIENLKLALDYGIVTQE